MLHGGLGNSILLRSPPPRHFRCNPGRNRAHPSGAPGFPGRHRQGQQAVRQCRLPGFGTGAPWRDLPPECGGWSTPTGVSSAGGTPGSGNVCRKHAATSRTWNGSWWTPATSRHTGTRREPQEEPGESAPQKGAEDQDASGLRFEWSSGPSPCHGGDGRRLHAGFAADRRVGRGSPSRRPGIRHGCNRGCRRRGGMEVAIPPRCNRKGQRGYDKYLCQSRHPVENAFLRMKEWRELRRGTRNGCRRFRPSSKSGAPSGGSRQSRDDTL